MRLMLLLVAYFVSTAAHPIATFPELNSTRTAPPSLLLGLKHSAAAREELDRMFWAVADPAQPETQLEGPEAIRAITQVDPEIVEAATAWLREQGCDMRTLRISRTGDAIEVAWPPGAGLTQAPKAPAAVADYLILKGAVAEPALRHRLSSRPSGKGLSRSAGSSMGPTGQKAAYGVPPSLKGTNSSNLQMVYGTGTFGYREDDIAMFFNTYAPSSSVKDVSFDKSNVWKGKTGKNFVEGELDVSYIAGMAPGVKTLVANSNISASTEAGEGFGAALLAFLVELNDREEVPLVLSLSLGSLSFGACDKVCQALSKKGGHSYDSCWGYLQTQFQACMFGSAIEEQRIDAELAKLGLRGVTVTAASGDGASHFAFGPFSGGVGEELDSIICEEMNMPVYPTCSPYVLSVGGVQWQSDDMYGPECSSSRPCGWTDGGSGFSWQHVQPAYQASTTPAYIDLAHKVAPKTMPGASTYNASGRGYPDVSALAQFGIPLCDYGGCSGSGGTSASAPTVAGMLSLVNDARLNNGLRPLGFINTKLYKLMEDPAVLAECFTDVGITKVGEDWDCNTYSSCDGCNDGGGAGKGFVAIRGWDAQTGWGQPKFAGWLKHLGSDTAVGLGH